MHLDLIISKVKVLLFMQNLDVDVINAFNILVGCTYV